MTVAVFSLNEAHLLPDCLARLGDFDELLVCDMHSTDDTSSVATVFGARVMQVPVVPIAERVRQLALDAARTEWVFFVDADEHVPPGLRASLALDKLPPEVAAVRLRYDNVAFGVQLAHALRGSAKYALVRPDLVRYDFDAPAHRPPHFDGSVMDAPASVPAILHHNFRSVSQSMEKSLRYALSDPHGADSLGNPFFLPRSIVSEILGGEAWRDGRAGVALVTINAIGRFYAALLDWESSGYVDQGWTIGTRRMLRLGLQLYRLYVWRQNRLRRRSWRSKVGVGSP